MDSSFINLDQQYLLFYEICNRIQKGTIIVEPLMPVLSRDEIDDVYNMVVCNIPFKAMVATEAVNTTLTIRDTKIYWLLRELQFCKPDLQAKIEAIGFVIHVIKPSKHNHPHIDLINKY